MVYLRTVMHTPDCPSEGEGVVLMNDNGNLKRKLLPAQTRLEDDVERTPQT